MGEAPGKPRSSQEAGSPLPWAAPTASSRGPGSQVLAPAPNAWQSPGMNAKHKVPDPGVGRVGGRQATHKQTQTFIRTGREMHPHSHHVFYPPGNHGNRHHRVLEAALTDAPRVPVGLASAVPGVGGWAGGNGRPVTPTSTALPWRRVWQEEVEMHPQGWQGEAGQGLPRTGRLPGFPPRQAGCVAASSLGASARRGVWMAPSRRRGQRRRRAGRAPRGDAAPAAAAAARSVSALGREAVRVLRRPKQV